MWASQIGQHVSSVFGGDKSKYDILDCQWTNGFISDDAGQSVDFRITSAAYVGWNSGQPALNYATDACITGYLVPAEYNTGQELADAFNYVTGTNSTRIAVQQSYVATTSPGNFNAAIGNGGGLAFTDHFFSKWAGVMSRWASSYGWIANLIQYEGSWSTLSYPGSIADGGNPSITAISSAVASSYNVSEGLLCKSNDRCSRSTSDIEWAAVWLYEWLVCRTSGWKWCER